MSYLSKSRIKTFFKFAFIFILTIFFWMLIVNAGLFLFQNKIKQEINDHRRIQVNAGSIFYFFPRTLYLRKIEISVGAGEAGRITIPVVSVKLSLMKLLLNQRVEFDQVYLNDLRIKQSNLQQILRHHAADILLFLQNTPQMDFILKMNRCFLELEDSGLYGGEYENQLSVHLKNGKLTVQGSSMKISQDVAVDPLHYYLLGHLNSSGLNIEKLLLGRDNLYGQLWGDIHGITVNMNGFILLKNTVDSQRAAKIRSNLFVMPKEIKDADTYFLDIVSQFQLNLPRINISQFKFSYNNIPMSLTGYVDFVDDTGMNLNGKVFPRDSKMEWKSVGLSFAGLWSHNVVKGSGEVNVELVKPSAEAQYAPEKISLAWEGMRAIFLVNKKVEFQLERPKGVFWTNQREHAIIFDHISADINWSDPASRQLNFIAPLYEGEMKGSGSVDSQISSLNVFADINFKDVQAVELDDLSVYFAKVEGKLSGNLHIATDPKLLVNGNMDIRQGRLSEFAFFQWLAETFKLPSLTNVDFDRLSVDYLINSQDIQLRNIDLQSHNVRLSGVFDVNEKQYVTSQLNLDLDRDLLQESPKLRRLLNGLGVDVPSLTFDFRLSGKQQSMNFQWLQTDFKKRIQANMPNILEWKIEKDLDDIFKE